MRIICVEKKDSSELTFRDLLFLSDSLLLLLGCVHTQ